ncbi:MAG: hypothetical protein IPM32_07780 [Ignavibacteriae bacterium]|nr:hypothetical protein [Ignavibacteriota bacterium]
MKENNIKNWYLENFSQFAKANNDEISNNRNEAAKLFETLEFLQKK